MIHTLIAEDNRYIAKYLFDLLSADARFQVVDLVADAFALEELCNESIDLVLMDVQTLHKHSGLAAGARIRASYPHIKVVVVTSLVDPEVLNRAKTGCADSLWYKDHGAKQLLEVIERTMAGEHIFPDAAPVVEMGTMQSSSISPAQLEILRCHIRGMTYREIGEKFQISAEGVRWNINEMVRRGGFANREELICAAIENKLVVTSLKED